MTPSPPVANTRPTPSVVTDDEVERVASVLWSHLDLNGHTRSGVRRAARAALAASDRDLLVRRAEQAREALESIASLAGSLEYGGGRIEEIARAALMDLAEEADG